MTDDNLEQRLIDALDSSTDSMPESAPPAFTWQTDTPVAGRSPRIARRAVYAGSGLVAAAVAVAVVATTAGSHSTAAPTRVGPHHVAASQSGHRQGRFQVQSAPKLLLAAAHERLQTGDATLRDGQFRYVRIVGPAPDLITYAKGSTTPVTHKAPAGSYTLDQYWIPKVETHVWLRRQSVVHDPNGGKPTTWRGRCDDLYSHTQDDPKGPACTRPGSFENPTPAFIAGLPRDPHALYKKLHSFAEKRLNPDKIHNANFEMFTTIDTLLSGGVITSDLTSTLYQVLSRIPGIAVVHGDKNYSGVAGTGFRLSTVLGHGPKPYRDTQTIIVDLSSGAYLGDKDVEAGEHYSSAVTTGVADRIGHRGH